MKFQDAKAKAGAALMFGAGALLFLRSGISVTPDGDAQPAAANSGRQTLGNGDGSGLSCSSRRGADFGSGGAWEKDLHAAPLMQYGLPWSQTSSQARGMSKADELHGEGWAGDPENHLPSLRSAKYRNPTTYVWRDDPSTEEECGPVIPLNGDEFCDAAVRLGIGRVMFLGDSLSKYQSVAFMNQIRATGWTNMPGNQGYHASHDCGGKLTVKVVFMTNKLLLDKSSPLVPSDMKDTWDPLPWKEEYKSGALSGGGIDPSLRTLFIVNSGAHLAKFEDYHDVNKAIDAFLLDIKTKLQRPNDIVVMRTTVPGHPACEKIDRPFASKDEREKFIASLTRGNSHQAQQWRKRLEEYRWDDFEGINEHLREAVQRYNEGGNHSGPSKVHLLDVVHMTNLRPDGHIGGIDNKNPEKKQDCLHYSLPGPIDWWNNLLFANLADLPITH